MFISIHILYYYSIIIVAISEVRLQLITAVTSDVKRTRVYRRFFCDNTLLKEREREILENPVFLQVYVKKY